MLRKRIICVYTGYPSSQFFVCSKNYGYHGLRAGWACPIIYFSDILEELTICIVVSSILVPFSKGSKHYYLILVRNDDQFFQC